MPIAERKSLAVELKADVEGSFRATFATLNVIDLDGDVTKEGAFSKQPVRVSGFGHNWSEYIIGDGDIDADKTKAWADAQFYLDTSRGLDTYRSVKRASAKKLQEWSYGFDVLKSSFGQFEGREVRFLEELLVHEVSPVMIGAGIGTGTDRIKSSGITLATRVEQHLTDTEELVRHVRAAVSMRAKEGRVLSGANRDLIKNTADALSTALEQLKALLAATDTSDEPAKAALWALRQQFVRAGEIVAS